MKTIEFEWPSPERGSKKTRSSFKSWKIPDSIIQNYRIKDGDVVDVTLTFGEESHTKHLRVTSGGELSVGKNLAEQIERYFHEKSDDQKNPEKSVSFKLKIASKSKFAPNLLEDIQEVALRDVPETTRKALIDARLGQGQFRTKLMKKYGNKCAVTGADIPELLRASHIKPWRDSKGKDEERLCVENGLLLIANLDAAFDAGQISFDAEGKMLFRKDLDRHLRSTLGFQKDGRLVEPKLVKPPSVKQKKFLNLHRKAHGFKRQEQ